jgi:hypothetical protein
MPAPTRAAAFAGTIRPSETPIVVITSWANVFNDDPMIAAAMLDRVAAQKRRVEHRRRQIPHAQPPGPGRRRPTRRCRNPTPSKRKGGGRRQLTYTQNKPTTPINTWGISVIESGENPVIVTKGGTVSNNVGHRVRSWPHRELR